MTNYANEPAENLFFSDLPYRSEQLDFKTLSNILGGCIENGGECGGKESDCCSGECSDSNIIRGKICVG